MSDNTRSVYSPSRGGAPPPKMDALSPPHPVAASAAWHAVLIGRTHDEVAAITAQAAFLLGARGSTLQPVAYQDITVRDGQRVMTHRWTKSTIGALTKAGVQAGQLTLGYESEATTTPVKGKQFDRGNLPWWGILRGRQPLPKTTLCRHAHTGDRPGSLNMIHSRIPRCEPKGGLHWHIFSP